MIFLHEVYRVKGACEAAFESAFREGWMPALAQGDDARLLWYFHHAHGSGVSYNFITVTAVADRAAWERLARRVQTGDLQAWGQTVDQLAYGCQATAMEAATWSPLRELSLAEIPVDGADSHEPSVYIEDTVSFSSRGEWAPRAERHYVGSSNGGLAELTAAFFPTWGGGCDREALVLQRVRDLSTLSRYIMGEADGAPLWSSGEALEARGENWTSKVLRTARWSPLD